jgi:hypothetical protein
VPLFVAGVLLVAGCIVGAGVVAVGAAIGGHGDSRSDGHRFEPGGDGFRGNGPDFWGRDGRDFRQPGPPPPPAATAVPPAPASVVPLPSSS